MAVTGAILLVRNWRRSRIPGRLGPAAPLPTEPEPDAAPGWRRAAFALVLLFALVIPSDATRDIPSRYGHRHPGLEYSAIYPRIRP